MSEPKFTKGPWTFCNDDKGIYQATGDGKRIKLLFSFDMSFVGISSSEHKANAALIAAAPEMYAMLEQLVEAVKTLNAISLIKIKDKLIEDAVNIIKKARGEE